MEPKLRSADDERRSEGLEDQDEGAQVVPIADDPTGVVKRAVAAGDAIADTGSNWNRMLSEEEKEDLGDDVQGLPPTEADEERETLVGDDEQQIPAEEYNEAIEEDRTPKEDRQLWAEEADRELADIESEPEEAPARRKTPLRAKKPVKKVATAKPAKKAATAKKTVTSKQTATAKKASAKATKRPASKVGTTKKGRTGKKR